MACREAVERPILCSGGDEMKIINAGRCKGREAFDAIMKEHEAEHFIIWAETAYKTGKCHSCGHIVRSNTGAPARDVLYDTEEHWLICPECWQTVGRVNAWPDEDG